jgi:hypothetical protein
MVKKLNEEPQPVKATITVKLLLRNRHYQKLKRCYVRSVRDRDKL